MQKNQFLRLPAALLLLALCVACNGRIDRRALVARNNPHVDALAPLNSLNLGNGAFTLTLDATGLQTFPEFCKDGLSLGTFSEWGWHSFPNPEGYTQAESLEDHPLPGHPHGIYAVQKGYGLSERGRAAATWIRENPHRLHLGSIGFDGMQPEEIEGVDQTLDMWDGVLHSSFRWKGTPVAVETVSGGEGEDLLAARIRTEAPLPVVLRFPYPTGEHSDDASDWCADERHSTELLSQQDGGALLRRTVDDTVYYVSLCWSGRAVLEQAGPNRLTLTPEDSDWDFCVRFAPEAADAPSFKTAAAHARQLWNGYWRSTGVIDFSRCTDPRAPLLERRVVQSQYLMRVQEAQHFPPAETGLTYNSWFGKFHLEMVMWHSFHWATWNQPELLRRQLAWYKGVQPAAREIAARQGFPGVRWMKMTDPSGLEAPSDVGSFLIWQQPHPIYMAELLWRAEPSRAFLEEYNDLVQESATMLAAFVTWDEEHGRYNIEGACGANESYNEDYTVNPAFELSYLHFALSVAQQWRERLGQERVAEWDDVLAKLAPLAASPDGIYLPAEKGPGVPDFEQGVIPRSLAAPAPPGGYINAQRGTRELVFTPMEPGREYVHATSSENLLAYGVLPANRLFTEEGMQKTLDRAARYYDWTRGSWSWNYPSLAMNATRLLRPDVALRAITMNDRSDLLLPGGNNYRTERLRMDLPGNGGLLLAVGMMCAGWDGCPVENPGFPKDGTWDVRWENLKPLP